MNKESAVGRSPDAVRTSVSAERMGLPEPASSAPPVEAELSQPWPAAPLFEHGHAPMLPSPKQKLEIGGLPPGTSPVPVIEGGEPDRHSPSVIVPLCGGAFASKRKLYSVPQRSAFALGFCASVSVDQV